MLLNPELLRLALWRINMQKQAFQPPDAMAAAGGAPPGDPAMAGAAPPPPPGGGGMAAGMDPAATQLAGAGGGDLQSMVTSAVQTAMAGQGGGAGGMKPVKPDINTVAMDVFQIKKMLVFLFNHQNIPLPPDILDGPNRNPATGEPMPPGAAGSTSDPARQSQPGPGQESAIPPIQPMQAAFPSGGGGEKAGFVIGDSHEPSSPSPTVKAAALASIINKMREAKSAHETVGA